MYNYHWVQVIGKDAHLSESSLDVSAIPYHANCRLSQLVLLEFSKSFRMQNKSLQVIGQEAYVLITCLVISRVLYHMNCMHPYHHRCSTRLYTPLLICRVHGFITFCPYPYMPINPIQLETRPASPLNTFLVQWQH